MGAGRWGPGTGYEDRGMINPNTPYYFLSSANLWVLFYWIHTYVVCVQWRNALIFLKAYLRMLTSALS